MLLCEDGTLAVRLLGWGRLALRDCTYDCASRIVRSTFGGNDRRPICDMPDVIRLAVVAACSLAEAGEVGEDTPVGERSRFGTANLELSSDGDEFRAPAVNDPTRGLKVCVGTPRLPAGSAAKVCRLSDVRAADGIRLEIEDEARRLERADRSRPKVVDRPDRDPVTEPLRDDPIAEP